MAEVGEMKLVANPDLEPGVVDLGDFYESDAARVEFVRVAALRALRKIYYATNDDTGMELLSGRYESGTFEQRRRALVGLRSSSHTSIRPEFGPRLRASIWPTKPSTNIGLPAQHDQVRCYRRRYTSRRCWIRWMMIDFSSSTI
jgi:hypothetical protein